MRPTDAVLEPVPGLEIPRSELRFRYSRAPGPGGQNVNKVNTRVTLLFDVSRCAALSADQRRCIAKAYPGRVSREGILRVVSSRHRTQAANRSAAIDRFSDLLASALKRRKPRRKTKVPARAHARRLAEKAHTSERKRLRRAPGNTDV